jgi:hypothetical protein
VVTPFNVTVPGVHPFGMQEYDIVVPTELVVEIVFFFNLKIFKE